MENEPDIKRNCQFTPKACLVLNKLVDNERDPDVKEEKEKI